MSISDRIVVMESGVVQQVGKPQEVYDNPVNFFVAKFLGTPPINVYSGRIQGGKLYIGEEAVLTVEGVSDQEVIVGIRPEGFIPCADGRLSCEFHRVEVMGRDVSVVSAHKAAEAVENRSIIGGDVPVEPQNGIIRFDLKPHKVFLFHKETKERLPFRVR